MARHPLGCQCVLIVEASRSHSDTPHSVGLLWPSDQSDTETSTWQNTTLTRDTSMLPAGFEPPIPASERRQTHALDRQIYKKKVKWSRYRPGVAQRVSRGIALLFHDRGTRRGWVVSSTPWPHFTPGKEPVPIVQEAGWAPGPVWTGGKSRPHRNSIPDPPARSQSLHRLSYPAH